MTRPKSVRKRPGGLSKSADAKEPAAQEWRSYIEPLLPIGTRLVARLADSQDPQLRHELYGQIYAGMAMAYMGLFLGDAEHPDFWPFVSQAYNFLAPNPDAVYYVTLLEGNGSYRLSGFRGTVRLIDVQIGAGKCYTRGVASTGSYDLDDLHIGADGSFEVILSPARPSGYDGDWWELAPTSANILIRQFSYDWLHEVDGRFAIERLDRPAIRPRPSAKEIEDKLRAIAGWAEHWTREGMDWASSYQAKGPVNKLYVRELKGGAASQSYIEGQFELEPNEALIYETEIPISCRYWNVQIANMLWATIDYTNRQTSLNGHTAFLDKDGKFRAVISAADPGVPNWLDTAGYGTATLVGRWNGSSSSPEPTLTRVRLADLRKHLPIETPLVSPEERDLVIRMRRKGVQLRRRW